MGFSSNTSRVMFWFGPLGAYSSFSSTYAWQAGWYEQCWALARQLCYTYTCCCCFGSAYRIYLVLSNPHFAVRLMNTAAGVIQHGGPPVRSLHCSRHAAVLQSADGRCAAVHVVLHLSHNWHPAADHWAAPTHPCRSKSLLVTLWCSWVAESAGSSCLLWTQSFPPT